MSSRFERIFWIDASNRLTVEQSYKGIAAENKLGDHAEAALRWLSNSNQEWLLLFDNCESNEILDSLIPSGDRGNILFTSRDPSLSLTLPRNAVFEVIPMDSEDAITLLLRAAQLEKRETDEELRHSATPIVEILGFLPLAIDIAGASIRMGQCHLDDYVDTFRNHREEMMKDRTFKGASTYNQAVYTAWDIAYDALKGFAKGKEDSMRSQGAKAALQILNLFAFFHNESIMEEIFKRAAESGRLSNNPKAQYSFDYCAELSELLKLNAGGNWDPFLFRKGIAMLLSFSLVTQDERGRYFSMHVLVHSWARDHLPSSAQPHQLCAAIALLSSSISWRFLTEDYAFRRQLLPHIKACKKHSAPKETTQSSDLDDSSNFALVLYEGGHWGEAEKMLVQVMETFKRMLGAEHPDTLTSMANLASTYRNQGRWKEAEDLDVQVMETFKRMLGEEQPSTLTSMSNLASTFWNQGRWKEAEDLEVQVMETRKRVLGEEHPSTLTSMANLAFTWKNQKRDEDAIALMKECLQLRFKVLDLDHRDTLSLLATLMKWKDDS